VTNTKRVNVDITEDSTKRVNYFDAASGTAFDHWGGTWGGYLATNNSAWGLSWTEQDAGATDASPALDITKRADASAATENTTKRVTV
jgi:hypothetical protein